MYWGLRDYGTARWEGGDLGCDHKYNHGVQGQTGQRADRTFTGQAVYKETCGKCGARRIDAQIGLERTPEEYVATMVGVFREVWRVLRDDGTLWLNLGASYLANNAAQCPQTKEHVGSGFCGPNRGRPPGLKPKDLCGIPWRVAFALQSEGWYLRSDIIWSKPNPMPESVTDRPTKSHEYIFLLTKSERYFWDREAVREAASYVGPNAPDKIKGPYGQGFTRANTFARDGAVSKHVIPGQSAAQHRTDRTDFIDPVNGRNIRSVWEIATQPYSGAHFATFPRKIPERCIRAGTSEKGCCPKCGAAWQRVTQRREGENQEWAQSNNPTWKAVALRGEKSTSTSKLNRGSKEDYAENCARSITTGWQPMCSCSAGDPVPCIVLDPFCGSGTTVMVAQNLGRIGIGLDLTYQQLAAERIGGPLFKAVVNSAFS